MGALESLEGIMTHKHGNGVGERMCTGLILVCVQLMRPG